MIEASGYITQLYTARDGERAVVKLKIFGNVVIPAEGRAVGEYVTLKRENGLWIPI